MKTKIFENFGECEGIDDQDFLIHFAEKLIEVFEKEFNINNLTVAILFEALIKIEAKIDWDTEGESDICYHRYLRYMSALKVN